MITFSFKPISWSSLPLIAASVRTFVVSWNDAAERKDSVASAGLGDTEKYGRNGDGRYVFARCLVFFVTFLVVKKFGLVYYRIRKDLV